MNAEKVFPLTPESEAEIDRIRRLADSLGAGFDEIIRSGAQGTTVGVQSRSLLVSQRVDSRTFFVQDARYGPSGKLGVLEAPDEEYIKVAQEILDKLEIPKNEIAKSTVIKEQMQTGEYNPKAREVRFEEIRLGKRFALLTRQIEGLPVWSSRVMLGLTRDRRVGFLEAHWPEIPKATVAEAHRLDEKVRQGWRPSEQKGAKVVEVQAGIIHSPAAGFVMDIYPAIRVIYASTDERFGKRAVSYLDRHAKPVPIPRQFDLPPESALPKRTPARRARRRKSGSTSPRTTGRRGRTSR